MTFILPGLTAFALVILIAARALIVGIYEIAAEISLRKMINNEWFLLLNALLSIFFAIVLFIAPGVGALALVWMIGITAILIGILLLAIAFRVRRWQKLA